MRLGQQAPGPVEGVVLAAPVAQGLVLHPPAALVELGVGQLDEVERVGHLGDVAKGVLEGLAVGPGDVEYAEADGGPPRLRPGLEPGARRGRRAAGDDIEQVHLAGAHVHNRGAPLPGPPPAPPVEQGLVEPEGLDRPDALGVVVDERGPVRHHRVVHRVPVTAQIPGHRGHGAAEAAHLLLRPPPSPVRHRRPSGSDAGVLAGERAHRAVPVRTTPAVLVPDEPGRAAEGRQVDELDGGPVLHPRHHATGRAAGLYRAQLDVRRRSSPCPPRRARSRRASPPAARTCA